jgi:hypothetical protein
MKGKLFPLVGALAIASMCLPVAALGQESEKPACNSELRGSFWPLEANSDAKLLQSLARAGKLEMCVVEVWRHKWEQVGVHIRQLEEKHKPRRSRERLPGGGLREPAAGQIVAQRQRQQDHQPE